MPKRNLKLLVLAIDLTTGSIRELSKSIIRDSAYIILNQLEERHSFSLPNGASLHLFLDRQDSSWTLLYFPTLDALLILFNLNLRERNGAFLSSRLSLEYCCSIKMVGHDVELLYSISCLSI